MSMFGIPSHPHLKGGSIGKDGVPGSCWGGKGGGGLLEGGLMDGMGWFSFGGFCQLLGCPGCWLEVIFVTDC